MPLKNPRGKPAKVRIKKFVNGELNRSVIVTRMVYETRKGWRMWDAKRRNKVPITKVDGRFMFEVEDHVEVPDTAPTIGLIKELRRSA